MWEAADDAIVVQVTKDGVDTTDGVDERDWLIIEMLGVGDCGPGAAACTFAAQSTIRP